MLIAAPAAASTSKASGKVGAAVATSSPVFTRSLSFQSFSAATTRASIPIELRGSYPHCMLQAAQFSAFLSLRDLLSSKFSLIPQFKLFLPYHLNISLLLLFTKHKTVDLGWSLFNFKITRHLEGDTLLICRLIDYCICLNETNEHGVHRFNVPLMPIMTQRYERSFDIMVIGMKLFPSQNDQ